LSSTQKARKGALSLSLSLSSSNHHHHHGKAWVGVGSTVDGLGRGSLVGPGVCEKKRRMKRTKE